MAELDPNEAQMETTIEDALNLFGWLWFHDRATNHTKINNPGFPDYVCVHPETGAFLVLELKTRKGRLSPAQQAWADALHISTVDYRVVRPNDLDEIVTLLRNRGVPSRS